MLFLCSVIYAEFKRSALALLSLSVFFISTPVNLFAYNPDSINYMLEESIEEMEETNLFEKILWASGGSDLLVWNESSYLLKQTSGQLEDRFCKQPPAIYAHSLIILYCCIKINFC